MDKLLIKPSKLVFLYFFPFSYSLSLIPLAGGSAFDILILPILVIFSFLSLLRKKIISKELKSICFLFLSIVFIITCIKLMLPLAKNYSYITHVALSLRVIFPLSIFLFLNYFHGKFLNLSEKIQVNFFKIMYILWLFFIFITCVFSILNFEGRLGLSFPFYSSGNIDRQVFGPAIAFVSVTLFITAYNNFIKNRIIFYFNICLIILTFFCSIGSGSRGPILIYTIFILSSLIKKFSLKLSKKFLYIFSFFLITVTSIISYVFFTFPKIFNISVIRAISLFQVIFNPTSDVSRGDQVSDFFSLLTNQDVWIIGDIKNPIIAPDGGPYFLLSNYGMSILFLFISIIICLIFFNREKFTSIFLLALLAQFIFSSETIFIPRYTVLVSWSYSIMTILYILKNKITLKKYL